MAGKLTFLAGFGAGYVLGARAGRDRYDQIASKAQSLWQDPRVQEKAGQAQQIVKEKASEAGSTVAGKVSETVQHKRGDDDAAPSATSMGQVTP